MEIFREMLDGFHLPRFCTWHETCPLGSRCHSRQSLAYPLLVIKASSFWMKGLSSLWRGRAMLGLLIHLMLGDSPYALFQLHNGDKVLAPVNTLTSCKAKTCLRKRKISKWHSSKDHRWKNREKDTFQIIPNRNLWISQESEYKSMKRNKMLVGKKKNSLKLCINRAGEKVGL